jgi:hypothetical protein
MSSVSAFLPAHRFILILLAVSAGIFVLAELFIHQDALPLLGPHFGILCLIGLTLTTACILGLWWYFRASPSSLPLTAALIGFTSLCLVGAIILLSTSAFAFTHDEYLSSSTFGWSTYRLMQDDLGQVSDILQVDVVLYHCDALGVVCVPMCKQRTSREVAVQARVVPASSQNGVTILAYENPLLTCK